MTKNKQEQGSQFLRYFGPILLALRELGGSGTPDEVTERIAVDLQIPDEVQNETLPSGDLRFRNQIAWARFYLVQEGLLDSSKRGVWSLTEQGRDAYLELSHAKAITSKWVRIFQERRRDAKLPQPEPESEQTEEEPALQAGDHRKQVLDLMQELPPAGFEQLCQAILREAGFNEVYVTGRSGDQGIDGHGTLQINPLVSFRVLFQCKRYRESVTPSHVRDFRGAMAGRADKGIILTTGTFTAEARRESSRDGVPPIELIDGEKLVGMLEALELGLRPVKSFEVDESFFKKFRT